MFNFQAKVFKSYNQKKSEYSNWWLGYTFGPRNPKVGQTTIQDHHNQCTIFHSPNEDKMFWPYRMELCLEFCSIADQESCHSMIDALVLQVKKSWGLPSHVMDIPIYCDYTSGCHQWCAHPFMTITNVSPGGQFMIHSVYYFWEGSIQGTSLPPGKEKTIRSKK